MCGKWNIGIPGFNETGTERWRKRGPVLSRFESTGSLVMIDMRASNPRFVSKGNFGPQRGKVFTAFRVV